MRVTGKAEVVSLYGAYHGLGIATSGLGGLPALRDWMPGAQRWPTFREGPAADCYRRPRGLTEAEHGVVAAEALEATIAEGGMNQVAALIIEPVQGPGGHVGNPQSWFDAVQDICISHEVLLIVDEVQTGLGRCGEMFASDLYGLQPDILVLGKALGGGLPFGATMARSDLIPPEIEREPWVAFTFQNQPIGAAAALAVLEIVERESGCRSGRRSSARGPPSGSTGCGIATRASETSAGQACSSASTWLSTAPLGSRRPRRVPGPSITHSTSAC